MAEIATLSVLLVLGFVAWLRMSKAKTGVATWKIVVILALAGILAFFLSGSLIDDSPQRQPVSARAEPPTFGEVVAHAPQIQMLVIGAGLLLFFVGGYVISYLHNRRLGKPWWFIFNPLQYAAFNHREWIQFALVFGASFALLMIGVNLGHGR
jgi:hypothetical protein